MKHRFEHAATLGVFLALILSPWIAGIVGVRASAEAENRALLASPELEWARVLDAEQFTDLEAFVTDHLPLRQESAAAINGVLYEVTGVSPAENAFVDRSGTWNLSEDFVDACVGPYRPGELAAAIDRWELAAAGSTDIAIVVAPDKSSILDHDFGARNRIADNCQVQRQRETLAAFESSDDLIDLWTPMRARVDSPTPLYFTNDSHWTAFGAISMADAVVSAFSPGLFEVDDVVDADVAVLTGDVTRRLGWQREEIVQRLQSARSGVTTEMTTEVASDPQGIRIYRSQADRAGDLIPGRTLIVHDSMTNYSEAMLAPYFEHVEFVTWIDLAAGALIPRVGDADRIVFETVQRAVYPRSNDPLTTAAFDAEMRAALTPD